MLTQNAVPENAILDRLFVCPNCGTKFTRKSADDCPICFMAQGSTERVVGPTAADNASIHWEGDTLRGKHGEVIAAY